MTVAIPSKDEEDDLVSMAADSNPRSKGKQSVASKRGADDMETTDNDNGNTRQSQCSCLTSEDNKDEQGVYYMECSRC